MPGMPGYVLVGGWPASGKTTLSRALARELDIAYLSKDEVKEALMDVLGEPPSVPESQRLGRAAVATLLSTARGCPAAVIDSTWYLYALRWWTCWSDPSSRFDARLTSMSRGSATGRCGATGGIEDTTGPVDVPAVASRVRAALLT